MAIRRANFRIDPANALGIEADETRSKLIALALSKPENYYKLRDTAIGAITKNLAVTIYDMYFDILTEGLIPQHADAENPPLGFKNADGARYQLCYPDVAGSPYSGDDFKPKIPEKEVNIICSKSNFRPNKTNSQKHHRRDNANESLRDGTKETG